MKKWGQGDLILVTLGRGGNWGGKSWGQFSKDLGIEGSSGWLEVVRKDVVGSEVRG